jgi:hypothetical protein
VLRATVQAFLDDAHPELDAEVLINGTRLVKKLSSEQRRS